MKMHAMMGWASAVLVTVLITAGCGAARHGSEGPRGTLRFNGEPKDAAVTIDERHLGPIGMFEREGVLLKPGAHRIVVTKEGYFPEYRMVEVTEDKLTTLEIKLREVP